MGSIFCWPRFRAVVLRDLCALVVLPEEVFDLEDAVDGTVFFEVVFLVAVLALASIATSSSAQPTTINFDKVFGPDCKNSPQNRTTSQALASRKFK